MLFQAFTVFLAIVGTTLSCMNTGARVTYAMGKDEEVPEHFGLLHDKNLSRTGPFGHWLLFRRVRVPGLVDGVRRCQRSRRLGHRSLAAWILVQLRLLLA